MTETGSPPPGPPGPTLALFLISAVAASLLFLIFSFLTFGLPLLVLALGAAIWGYVGLMRLIDHALAWLGARNKPPR